MIVFQTKGLQDLARRIGTFRTRVPAAIAAVIITQIRQTSAQGMDADGGQFAAYTDPYRAYKQRKFGSSDPVNLRASGRMMDSLNASQEGTEVFVTVGDDQKGKAEGVSKKRKFLGVHPDTPMIAERVMVDLWNKTV